MKSFTAKAPRREGNAKEFMVFFAKSLRLGVFAVGSGVLHV
ncbi:MAG TPA: hypothetical protein PLM02_12980 [Azonexus sp.]|jgi:hypothetical protein|nr:hypothetical protein [Azonexus sp.]